MVLKDRYKTVLGELIHQTRPIANWFSIKRGIDDDYLRYIRLKTAPYSWSFEWIEWAGQRSSCKSWKFLPVNTQSYAQSVNKKGLCHLQR
jgi:hypothetical protein